MTAEQVRELQALRDRARMASQEIEQQRSRLKDAEHAYWRAVGAGEAVNALEAGKSPEEVKAMASQMLQSANEAIRVVTQALNGGYGPDSFSGDWIH